MRGALLDAVLTGPVDARVVREQIIAETRGNPLALLELPRAATPAHLAGGFGLPGALEGRIEDSFRQRVDALPAPARRLLLLGGRPIRTGDPVLVWRARGEARDRYPGPRDRRRRQGWPSSVRGSGFRHPLARSAVYRSGAGYGQTGRCTGPWPRPPIRRLTRIAGPGTGRRAAAGPDEEVAAELEDSAGRAQAARAGSPRRRPSWNARRC